MNNLITAATSVWHDWPNNFSNGQNVSGIADLFQYVDFVSGQKLGAVLLFVIAAITFITLKTSGFPASKAIGTMTYGTFMISIILMLMGLVSFNIVLILLIAAIAVTIVVRDEANKGF